LLVHPWPLAELLPVIGIPLLSEDGEISAGFANRIAALL
jgi:hypothetical protein